MLDIEALMEGAELGDKRRGARALQIVAGIVQGQASGTHGTQGGANAAPWAHAMGAYRFFDNDAISLRALYAPSRAALADLVPPGGRCFVAHDFSILDFTNHNEKADRVRVGDEWGRGYDLYAALVIDDHGRPLGAAVAEVRTAGGCLSSESDEAIVFVDHLAQAERGILAAAEHLPTRNLVHLMDREFDDLALLRLMDLHDEKYVIRARDLARIVQYNGLRRKLGKVVDDVQLKHDGTTERRGKRYDIHVGETHVVFDGPSWRGCKRGKKRTKPTKGPAIDVRVVITELREHDTGELLRWVLLTNLDDPVSSIVQAYLWRWRVERLFYLTKVGLRIEHWKQESGPRIARRLALTMLAATVIYQLQAITEEQPELHAVVKEVATLGGWLGRKRDPIGPIVLMRGVLILLSSLSAIAQYGAETLDRLAGQIGLGFARNIATAPQATAGSA